MSVTLLHTAAPINQKPSAPTTGPGHDAAATVNVDLLPAIVEHADVKRPVRTATAQVLTLLQQLCCYVNGEFNAALNVEIKLQCARYGCNV